MAWYKVSVLVNKSCFDSFNNQDLAICKIPAISVINNLFSPIFDSLELGHAQLLPSP
jgi:hypothetical protein